MKIGYYSVVLSLFVTINPTFMQLLLTFATNEISVAETLNIELYLYKRRSINYKNSRNIFEKKNGLFFSVKYYCSDDIQGSYCSTHFWAIGKHFSGIYFKEHCTAEKIHNYNYSRKEVAVCFPDGRNTATRRHSRRQRKRLANFLFK